MQNSKVSMLPYQIDPWRIAEKREIMPSNHWDFVFHENFWYHKRSRKDMAIYTELEADRREFGINFKSIAEFQCYADDMCETALSDNPVLFKCNKCNNFVTNSSYRLESHKNSERCKSNIAKLETQKNGQKYLRDCEKPVVCKICNVTYRTKGCLVTHLRTKRHADKVVEVENSLPVECAICKGQYLNNLKFRRHLKSAKKCKKLARENAAHNATWLNYHARFGCKFGILPKVKVIKVV